jgi:hypothetical protein
LWYACSHQLAQAGIDHDWTTSALGIARVTYTKYGSTTTAQPSSAALGHADLNRRALSPRARIIGTFEALEARVLYKFMGYEDYKSSGFDDAEPYPDDWTQRSN